MGKYSTKISRELRKKKYGEASIIAIISWCRLLLEEERAHENFPHLNLYCNWVLHGEISKSLNGYKIIEGIVDSLIKNADVPPNLMTERELYECVCEKNLKNEMSTFFRKNAVSPILFEDMVLWKSFYIGLLRLIIDRPIQFPSRDLLNRNSYKKIRSIYWRIMNRAKPHGLGIDRIELYEEGDKLGWKVNICQDGTTVDLNGHSLTYRGTFNNITLLA